MSECLHLQRPSHSEARTPSNPQNSHSSMMFNVKVETGGGEGCGHLGARSCRSVRRMSFSSKSVVLPNIGLFPPAGTGPDAWPSRIPAVERFDRRSSSVLPSPRRFVGEKKGVPSAEESRDEITERGPAGSSSEFNGCAGSHGVDLGAVYPTPCLRCCTPRATGGVRCDFLPCAIFVVFYPPPLSFRRTNFDGGAP